MKLTIGYVALGLMVMISSTPFVPNDNGGSPSLSFASVSAFTAWRPSRPPSLPLYMSTTETGPGEGGFSSAAVPNNGVINYNAVYVSKSGGLGVRSASEMMSARGSTTRRLGAPPPRRPVGGRFVTLGGVEIDATVRPLRYTHGANDDGCGEGDDCDVCVPSFFSSMEDGGEGGGMSWGSDGAIERLVNLLDHRRGAVLTSSYEFPGR